MITWFWRRHIFLMWQVNSKWSLLTPFTTSAFCYEKRIPVADSFLKEGPRWLRMVPFYPVLSLNRERIHCYASVHMWVHQDSEPLLATAPCQYLHTKAAEFLMRTTALNPCQHPRGGRLAYTWKLSQKGVESRDSMCTNRIYQSLARSPGPCSLDSSHTGSHPQWRLSICHGEKA